MPARDYFGRNTKIGDIVVYGVSTQGISTRVGIVDKINADYTVRVKLISKEYIPKYLPDSTGKMKYSGREWTGKWLAEGLRKTRNIRHCV